ncbi:hypothetical protein ACHWQZ_G000505 [Mnemiopsis leidyi]
MSVEVRPRHAYNDDSIRRHSLNMALMSDVSSRKPSRENLCEHIRQVSLEEHLPPICDEKEPCSNLNRVEPQPSNVGIGPDSGTLEHIPAEIPLREEDLISNAESFDLKVLQMSTSRTVGRSLANQLVAESLNIEPDDSSMSGEIVAGKVPTVSDIPRPSIVSESDISKVGVALQDTGGGGLIPEQPEEEIETEAKSSTPTKDIYALVETSVKFRVKETPEKLAYQSDSDTPNAQISPIYSKVIKTVAKTDETKDPLLVPELSGITDRPASLALTQEETREVMEFINSRINSRSQLDVDTQMQGSGNQLNVESYVPGSKNQLNADSEARETIQ